MIKPVSYLMLQGCHKSTRLVYLIQ